MSLLREIFTRIWRLGDIQLPIGNPWFEVGWPRGRWGWYPWAIFRPIRWQGWAALLGLFVWLIGFAALVVHMKWLANNWLLYIGIMPTVAFWAGLVGAKSKHISPWDSAS